jgi:Predicted membrane protein/domain
MQQFEPQPHPEEHYQEQMGEERSTYSQQQEYRQPVATNQYASVGKRWIAILCDSIIIGLISNQLTVWSGLPAGPFGAWFDLNLPVSSISFGGLTLVAFIYYVIMEGFWGASAGKMLMKLRVVSLDGRPLTWKQVIIRNLLRIIDGLFGYLVAAIFVWNSPWRQRFGDMAAKTSVIYIDSREEYRETYRLQSQPRPKM